MASAWINFLLLNFLTIDRINALTSKYERSMRVFGSWHNISTCVLVDDYTANRLQHGRNDQLLSLVRYEEEDACKPMPRPTGIKNLTYMLAVYSSGCKFQKMIENARGANAQGLMVVANLTKYPFRLDIGENPKNISLIVITLELYYRILQADTKKTDIKLQLLSSPPFMGTGCFFFALPILAVCTFIAGMFFSAYSHLEIEPIDSHELIKVPNNQNNLCEGCVCPAMIWDVLFISLLVIFILLLYFFYDIFVWVMIVNVCFCITVAFCILITEVIVRISSPSSIDRWRLKCCGQTEKGIIDIRGLFFLPICAVPPCLLVVFRKERNIWILQDFCGIAMSIVLLRCFRFSKLKSVVFGGILFYIYDIFMVYLTPLFMSPTPRTDSFKNPIFHLDNRSRTKRFTDGRTSVMEEIATGSAGKSGVTLPVSLLFPKIDWTAPETDGCHAEYSFWLLGLGDIIVPGVVAAFAFRCDLCLREPTRRLPWLYSVVVVIGYVVGFVLIEFIMKIMETGQPALLTLLPCTILPVAIIAYIRKEIGVLWHGSGPLQPEVNEDCGETKKKKLDEKTSLRQ